MDWSRSPTLVQLRALVAVADNLSFREAAKQLGVTQPSVSGALGALEASLGVALARRSSRSVELTTVGRLAAARARQVLDGVDGLVEGAQAQPSGPAPTTLRLGVIPTVAPYILAPVLRTLGRRWPSLRPEVTEDQTARLLAELRSGKLDAAVMALPAGVPGVVELPLYWEDFVLLLPPDHPSAGRTDLDQEILSGMRLLLLQEGHCLSGQILDICRQVGATDHPARATSLTTIAQLVAAGLGATLLPATALPVETRKGKLAVARFRRPAPGRCVGLVHSDDNREGEHWGMLAEYFRQGLLRPGFAGRSGR